MNLSKVLATVALVMGVSTALFAGNPKPEPKAATPNEAKTESAAGAVLYWYKVSYAGNPSGYIPAGATLQAHDVQDNVQSDCDPGNTRDCFRGFVNPQTTMTTSAGDGQIKTDEQP